MLDVIIVGAGVAGLALAKLLSDGGVNLIVLEGRDRIAPDEGASIGIGPNGAEVLDRIGCLDSLRTGKPFDLSIVRGPDGEFLASHEDVADFFIKRNLTLTVAETSLRLTRVFRFKYPIFIFERRGLLQALYDSIQDHSKLLPGQKVIDITPEADSIMVRTQKGRFHAKVVIGADGTFSTVGREMTRLSGIPADQAGESTCDFSCMFGVSPPSAHFPLGSVSWIFKRDHSYLIMIGTDGRTYWFLWDLMKRTYHGKEIPRLSKADELEIAKKYEKDQLTENVTFGSLYSAALASTLTPVAEHVRSRWYHGRMMIIGDAAHKFDPTSGQGGNAALESAATLADHILRGPRLSEMSETQLHEIFAAVQEKRMPKVHWLMKDSHDQQHLRSMLTPDMATAALAKVPLVSKKRALRGYTNALDPKVTLRSPKVQSRL